MQRITNKDERQTESIVKWRNAKGRGTLNLTMRFGKTRVAKLISERTNGKFPNCKIIIIAPNDIVRKNAEDNMVVNDNTQIYTSNSYIEHCRHLRKGDDCDLLIIDEIHKVLSGKILDCIKSTNSHFRLGLTGAKLTNEDKAILEELDMPVIDIITEEEALFNQWISPYVEYNLAVQLDDTDKVKYAKYSDILAESMEVFTGSHNAINAKLGVRVFESDFKVAIAAYTGIKYTNPKTYKSVFIKPDVIRNLYAESMGWNRDLDLTFEYNQRINELYNPDNIYEKAKHFKSIIKRRNDILICNRPKLNTAISIIRRFKDRPCICFNESTEMADMLSQHFSETSIAYHSNIESRYVINPKTGEYYTYKNGNPIFMGATRLKKLAIEGVRNGTYKQLFTAKALNEGVTVENIELVITTGGDTNIATHAQRRARGLTMDYRNPRKVCLVVNLYIDDFYIKDRLINSRDKQKLKCRQSENDAVTPIWINDVSEIKINDFTE